MIYVYGSFQQAASLLLIEGDLHGSASWLDHKEIYHRGVLIFHAVCDSSGRARAEEPCYSVKKLHARQVLT